MNKRIFGGVVVLFLLWFGLPVSTVHALQTIVPVEGRSVFVDISQRDLNLIKFPFSGVRVYTSSRVLDIKIDGSDVFVNIPDDVVGQDKFAPQEVFFVTPAGTYSLVLVPKGIPAETIIVRIPQEDIRDALEWEAAHDYVTGLKELIKAMYIEIPPMGFAVKDVNREVSRWEGTRQVLLSLYSGATLEGEIHKLTNVSNGSIRILEREFYQRGVLAVSIDRHELLPNEETHIYIVRRSESQRQMDELLREHNPLDILRVK